MECIKVLQERRSIKKYKTEQIKQSELDVILECAKNAPTGMNMQSPVMVVVQNEETIKEISKLNAEVMGMQFDPFYGAPTVVIVFGDTSCVTYKEDACLVAGNILNAAAALGLGGCWIHRAYEVFQSEDGKKLMKKWGLGDNYAGVANCILGYADQSTEKKPRKENYVIYDK